MGRGSIHFASLTKNGVVGVLLLFPREEVEPWEYSFCFPAKKWSHEGLFISTKKIQLK